VESALKRKKNVLQNCKVYFSLVKSSYGECWCWMGKAVLILLYRL